MAVSLSGEKPFIQFYLGRGIMIFSENLFEFGLVVKEEMLFKDTSILAQWSGTIYASLVTAIMGNIHVKYFKFRLVVQEEMSFNETVYRRNIDVKLF